MPPEKPAFFDRSVASALAAIREKSRSEKEKGEWFEDLFMQIAPRDKALEVAKIYRPPGRDLVVDLVARLNSGEEAAVQCKFHKARCTKRHVESFIAGSGSYNLRWFVAASGFTQNAETCLIDHGIKSIDINQYASWELAEKVARPQRQPLLHQREAIAQVLQGFAKTGESNGRLIMACGTGKTFTALQIAESIAPGKECILFVAPSIALVAQARREWLDHCRRPFASLVVCSDKSVQQKTHSYDDMHSTEISGETTTQPEEIAKIMRRNIGRGHRQVVFCTYQSLDKLSCAQLEHRAPAFALAFVDEAHRTVPSLAKANGEVKLFQTILDPGKIKSAKRLYMTATPKIYDPRSKALAGKYDIADMDDNAVYGPQFYRISFKKAVEDGILCDYKVIALGIRENLLPPGTMQRLLDLNEEVKGPKSHKADENTALAICAASLAINGFTEGRESPGVLARTIGYTNNIARSVWAQKALQSPAIKDWTTRTARKQNAQARRAVGVTATHLDGSSSAFERNVALDNLRNNASVTKPRIITNAKLFTEGVDVPALNAIVFIDPKRSKVESIQAVGRVMRRDEASGKGKGYIVVPVVLPEGADINEMLVKDKQRFKPLGDVLRALQSHDSRLYSRLDEHLAVEVIGPDESGADGITPPPGEDNPVAFQQELLDAEALQHIYAKIAENSGIANAGHDLAQSIINAVKRAARKLESENTLDVIAETIGTPRDNKEESYKTAALLIANACIMHKRLQSTGNLEQPATIEQANVTGSPKSVLQIAWERILQKDYTPIFKAAQALLVALPESKIINQAIRDLINVAVENADKLNDLGFDHAGPLYHKILGKPESEGVYYTKNLSAYLLAGLAFNRNFTDWGNARKVRNLRICDPACGTGTLLMAALNAIKRQAGKAQGLSPKRLEALHKHLVENVLYGYDINQQSIQLAACNLTIGAPNTDYSGMNLIALRYGPQPGTAGEQLEDVRHGALEMLLEKDNMNELEQAVAATSAIYGSTVEQEEQKITANRNFNALVCNPPFTDTSKAGTRFGDATVKAMRARLTGINNRLREESPKAADAISKQSIQPYFTPLGRALLQPGGTFANVLPVTMFTAENARAQRRYIADNYHIETIVTSHDPKHPNFSENTGIHECLLIARRNADTGRPTRFIQLARYPADVQSTDQLLAAIENGNAGEWYSETMWPAERMRAGDWSPVQWFNSELARAADKINTRNGLMPAGNSCPISFAPRSFRSLFDYESGVAESGVANAFCTIAESVRQTIRATPDTHAAPKRNMATKAESSWEKASHLLINERFGVVNNRVLAIYSDAPAFGSAYFAMAVPNQKQAKAFAAFLNSSFGVIQMLNRRTKTLTYPMYEAGHIKTLQLPDPAKVDLQPLLRAFEKVKATPLQRLAQCHQDPARKVLDHAAAKALGVDPALTDKWREWLSQEPTITNRPAFASP